MSAESGGTSRPPQSNSAKCGRDGEPPEPENETTGCEDLPDPADRLREFLDEMGPVAHRPIADTHGVRVRPECFEEEVEEYEVALDDGGTVRREEIAAREAVPVWQAVGEMLEWHEEYHRSALRLEYGEEGEPTHELLDVDLDNSWMAAYQEQERAKLKALERETCGYEGCEECETRWCQSPDDHDTERVSGRFEEPVVVLTSRTASGVGRSPVDHAREIAGAWTDGGVRRSLRYVVDKLGLAADEWVRWTQGEPHTGKRAGAGYGENTGHHHPHDVMIFDEAAADGEITAGTFRPVIEKHVEECAGAGPVAHDLDVEDWEGDAEEVGTVEVKRAEEEIEESVASYAAAYLANESKDLLERSPEYLMWAATMWATGTQKGIKSDSANHAIEADRCRHSHETGDSELAHGEQVRKKRCRCAEAPYGPGCSRCDGRGYHVVCSACGSPWGIEQDSTLVAHRTAREGAQAAACDGGAEEPETAEERAEEGLRERWPTAREAAVVSASVVARECGHEEPDTCPLCATETESPDHTVSGSVAIPAGAEPGSEVVEVVAGFERPPTWKAKAVIRDGEELPASGGSVDKRPLKLRSSAELRAGMSVRTAATLKCMDCREMFDTPAEYAGHGHCAEEGAVGVGWRGTTDPPAEEGTMPAGEFLAAVPDRLLDPADGDGGDDADGELRRRVERAASEGAVSVAEVMGRLCLPASARSVVEEVVG